MLVLGVQRIQLYMCVYILFHHRLLCDVEHSSLCCVVGPAAYLLYLGKVLVTGA